MENAVLAAEAVVAAAEEAEVEAVTAAAVGTAHLVPTTITRHRHHPNRNRAASFAVPMMASTNVPSVANLIVL